MKISKALDERINKAIGEKIEIVPYDHSCPKIFKQEVDFLKKRFPKIINRIEHFGSTAVPEMWAKPIVDMLVEVSSLKETKKIIVPDLMSLGYDYFWRPVLDRPPMYAWFIKRDSIGVRTHHIHMVEAQSNLWDRIYFRDYLRKNKNEARLYEKLKLDLAKKYPNDREKYTRAKTKYIVNLTNKAKQHYIGTL